MFFVDKLISMGARIVLCDPHRAIVAGPSRMHGASMISPDIRAGMAMLLAAVCAEGTSTINNADQIERGYERIDERLNALGAKITPRAGAGGGIAPAPSPPRSVCGNMTDVTHRTHIPPAIRCSILTS